MRVPMGSPALFTSTQALSPNLTTLPSGRWDSLRTRTTTACRISPRRTLFASAVVVLDSDPAARCFCTTTTIRSPKPRNLYQYCLSLKRDRRSSRVPPGGGGTHRLSRAASSSGRSRIRPPRRRSCRCNLVMSACSVSAGAGLWDCRLAHL